MIAAVVVASVLAGNASPEPVVSPSSSAKPLDPNAGFVPLPADVAGTVEGTTVTFTWTNPDPAEDDSYIWYPVTLDGGDGATETTDETTASVPKNASGVTCIEVVLVRADGRSSNPARECVQ